jgi:hypothetical protein
MTEIEEQDSVVLSDGALAQSLGFVTPLHRSNLKVRKLFLPTEELERK